MLTNHSSQSTIELYNKIGLYMEGIMANTIFGNRIRKLRLNSGMTMDELASKLNITKSRISMWENNGAVPREEMLIKLSNLFKVSIDYLLGNEKLEDNKPDNQRLNYIQRSLGKLDDERLEKAESVLKAVFEDIFEEEEDHGDL